jgi:hypothetical protein
MTARMPFTRQTAHKWREAEFLSCFLMGLGFGMLSETQSGLAACVAAVICAASLCLMLSARSLRSTMGDLV